MLLFLILLIKQNQSGRCSTYSLLHIYHPICRRPLYGSLCDTLKTKSGVPLTVQSVINSQTLYCLTYQKLLICLVTLSFSKKLSSFSFPDTTLHGVSFNLTSCYFTVSFAGPSCYTLNTGTLQNSVFVILYSLSTLCHLVISNRFITLIFIYIIDIQPTPLTNFTPIYPMIFWTSTSQC